MAQVFLSYDRADGEKGRVIAEALEQARHEVWWDFQITGGAEYGKEIEQALAKADAVVVLWSMQSVDSAWVRDEAAAGRDRRCLIPVQLDATTPPMGFRQYQSIDLTRWKGGRRIPNFDKLLRAVDQLSARPGAEPTAAPVAADTTWFSRRWAIATLGAVVLVGALFAAWTLFNRRSAVPVVTVVATDNSAASSALARDLFVKLGHLQSANPDAMEIIQSDSGADPDFIIQVASGTEAGEAEAHVALLGGNRGLLWSKDFQRPANQRGDLKQQVALTAARVLDCATEAVTHDGDKLDRRTLRLYLNGCATLSELAWTDFRSLVPVFREVTKRAPHFEDGWGKLVETEAYVIGWETLPKTSVEAKTLRADMAEARKVNPRMAEAYWAEFILLPANDIAGASELVEKAMRDNPDEPLVRAVQADFLGLTGRVSDRVDATKAAVELAPLSSDSQSTYINALTYAGRLEAALKEIEKAEKLWPGTRTLIDARFRFHARYGDPKEALRIVQSGVNPSYASFEPFLLARIDPTTENIDRALAHAAALVDQSPRGSGWYFLALAQFGREDEIYSILEKQPDLQVFTTEMFFRPTFHRLRHDVRFMAVMKRFDLVNYWRTTGKWPDFCFEPDLPYDCKTEAAKLS